jgi:glycerophosphoryl diester phosphodiesterase
MTNLLKIILLSVLFTGGVVAETVPVPADNDVRYVIQIPPGGLHDFLRWQPSRIPLISHHRGGPAPGYPENAIETMDNALKYGPGLMEIDVAQLADGTLILMHDNRIDRTTTGTGLAANQTWPQLEKLFLVDSLGATTEFRIPRLENVLRWTKGRAILTLDIKRGTDFGAVVQAVKDAGAEDYVAAIAYTLDQAKAFHALAPDMPITVSMRNAAEIAAVEASGIPARNVIAWTGTRLLPSAHYTALHGKGWRVIMGTLGRGKTAIDNQIAANDNDARYLEIYKSGVDVIATDRFWAVQNQIRNPNLYFFVQKRRKIKK